MPGLDGYATLERLRADPATESIPVVIVSGSAPTGSERQTLAHALTILPKSSTLREAVEGLLGGRRRHG